MPSKTPNPPINPIAPVPIATLFAATLLIAALTTGCIRTQTTLITPGQPIRLLAPVTAPPKSTATEIAKGNWTVNDTAVTLPAGAYVVVLTTQPMP